MVLAWPEIHCSDISSFQQALLSAENKLYLMFAMTSLGNLLLALSHFIFFFSGTLNLPSLKKVNSLWPKTGKYKARMEVNLIAHKDARFA